MIEHGRRLIEEDDVDGIGPERSHQMSGEIRRVAVCARGDSSIDVDRDVDVAVRLRAPENMGAEQIRLQHFPSWGERLRDQALECSDRMLH